MKALRVGILGAARIAPSALVRPARQVPGVEVTAVAARDRSRAERFARRHGIGTVFDSYRALVESDAVDAVYIPLPNGLHGRWTIAAVEAGKHVLCEKPFAANAAEAAEVNRRVAGTGKVVMEAFHYRYHPLAGRALSLVNEGAIGDVRHVEAHLCLPLPILTDIRYNLELAGGALMDAGCYAVHALRTFGPGEPVVESATAHTLGPGIDRSIVVDLRYPTGATGRVIASLLSARLLGASLRITGSAGTISSPNFVAPQAFNRLTLRTLERKVSGPVLGDGSYTRQLAAFRAAVVDGGPVLTGAADAVPTMAIIDAAYRAAGLPVRLPTT